MPQFDTKFFPSQIFWFFISFSILYFISRTFIIPSVEKVLKNRKNYINNIICDIENIKTKTQKLEKQYSNQLIRISNEINKNTQKLENELRSNIEIKKKQLLDNAKIQLKNNKSTIQELCKTFHSDEDKACINLAKYFIQNISNKEADLNLLQKIYFKIK